VTAVRLRVRSKDRSILFWRYVVGLRILEERPGAATLGVADRPLVVLESGAATSVLPGRAGLGRIVLYVPDDRELGRVLARLVASRVPIDTSDDGRTKEIRLDDPDGLGLAIAVPTPGSGAAGGVTLVDGDGDPGVPRPRLDVPALIDLVGDEDLRRSLPDATLLGGVVLVATDTRASTAFYDALGLVDDVPAHGSDIADASAGPGAPPAPPRAARLLGLEVRPGGLVSGAGVRERPSGGGNAGAADPVLDPDGTAILPGPREP
jgi:catechol 2,3-dioxygenase